MHRIVARLLTLALMPLTLLTGCKLWQAPIYHRLELPPNAVTTNVLFIGNSLTYYNDLVGLVQQFSAREEHPLSVDSVTFAYATLNFHWTSTDARKRLENPPAGGWNFVVLQEFSNLAATDPEKTVADYRRFGDLAARVGAKPIIVENWTRIGRDDDLPKFEITYRNVQQAIGGTVAPVGEAWRICRDTHKEINLFEDDRHPTMAGTYLSACVIYRAIYQKPTTGLPTMIEGLKLDPKVAVVLQGIADQVRIDR